ncbi:MAG: LLM class F420-dependent oxidoreductase [Candidatus Bathyarchaeia archaeon]
MGKVLFGAKFNVHPALTMRADYAELRRLVLKCEKLGFYSAWVMDHLIWGSGSVLESWTTLSALAEATTRIRLGTLVSCVSFRLPSVLAKMAATFDVFSEGRLEMGIGAGWKEDEYRAYGIPFPSPAVRIGQLREAIIILRRMWSEPRASFKGRYFQVEDAVCEPKPVQKPRPPIWVGGQGEKLLLRVVAQVGDGCNLFGSPAELEHKLEVIRNHCEAVGRGFSEIRRSWTGDLITAPDEDELKRKVARLKPAEVSVEDYRARNIIGTPGECIRKIEQYAALGFTYLIPSMRTMDEDLELISDEIISAFQ